MACYRTGATARATVGSLPQRKIGLKKRKAGVTAGLFDVASSIPLGEDGAGEGIRTLDPNLGKVVLYP